MSPAQIRMLAESARTLANSCDAATADGSTIGPDVLASLRRKLNAVKNDGKGLANKRTK